jgi:hypothetical protein
MLSGSSSIKNAVDNPGKKAVSMKSCSYSRRLAGSVSGKTWFSSRGRNGSSAKILQMQRAYQFGGA